MKSDKIPTSVRFEPEEKEWLLEIAGLYGRSVVDVIRSSVRFTRTEWLQATPEQRAQILVGQQREIELRGLLIRAGHVGLNPKDILGRAVEERESVLGEERKQLHLLEVPKAS